MSRVMRMGIGLVSLIPVLGLGGWLLSSAGLEGETVAWLILGLGAVWIALMIWWSLRGPAQLTEEFRARYLAFLRHAEYRPLEGEKKDRG